MQQKLDQGTLGIQRSTLIGSRTRLGPSMDPAMALQYTYHDPLYIGYIFAFYAANEGGPLCPQSPLIQFSLHRMQKYSQYIKGHVWCIVGPWQGPLKDQGGS